MPYPVVHFEIVGDNGAELQNFYRELFDWNINADNPMSYGYVSFSSGGSLTGGISHKHMPVPNYVTIFVGVPDLAAHLAKAESLGGQTLIPPTDIPGGGSFAHLADPAGNRIGLFRT